MEIELGYGNVMIGTVTRKSDGVIGLIFRPVSEQHEIGSRDTEWQALKEYTPTELDVVVYIPRLDSARVLQDNVNSIALQLNGYAVTDKIKAEA